MSNIIVNKKKEKKTSNKNKVDNTPKISLDQEYSEKEQYFANAIAEGKDITSELTEYYTKNYEVLDEYYTNNKNKADIYDKYQQINNDTYLKKDIYTENNFCEKCKVNKLFCNNDAIMICPNCLYESTPMIEPEKPSYKDPPTENTSFAYQREKHCEDHLTLLQAKETTKIKPEVIDAVLVEFVKERHTNLADLNLYMVKDYLKRYIKYGFNKYYENAQQIINILSGQRIVIPQEREEAILSVFRIVEKAFDVLCPDDRYNLISYPFVMYKICQMLEFYEYLPYLPQSKTKHNEQCQLWKQMCEHTGLPYIPNFLD